MNNETVHAPTGFRIGRFPIEHSGPQGAVVALPRREQRSQRSRVWNLRRALLWSAGVLAAAALIPLAQYLVAGGAQLGARLSEASSSGAPRLKVASVVHARPSSETRLPVSIVPPRLPAHGLLLVSGLPSAVTLSAGRMLATGQWLVPLSALSSLTMHVPAGMAGSSELTITLLGGEEPAAAPQASATLLIAP